MAKAPIAARKNLRGHVKSVSDSAARMRGKMAGRTARIDFAHLYKLRPFNNKEAEKALSAKYEKNDGKEITDAKILDQLQKLVDIGANLKDAIDSVKKDLKKVRKKNG